MKKKTDSTNPEVNKPRPSAFDPFGSYSGVPLNPDEIPIQDADDL